LSSGKNLVFKYAEFIHIAVEKFKPQYLIGHSLGGKRVCITNRFIKVMPEKNGDFRIT
jgi:hypothetical protein